MVETLQTIMNGPDRNKQIEASVILSGITDYKFIICLIIYQKVFSITARLSDLLQTESVDLGNAATVIKATMDSFEKMTFVVSSLKYNVYALSNHYLQSIIIVYAFLHKSGIILGDYNTSYPYY